MSAENALDAKYLLGALKLALDRVSMLEHGNGQNAVKQQAELFTAIEQAMPLRNEILRREVGQLLASLSARADLGVEIRKRIDSTRRALEACNPEDFNAPTGARRQP